MPKVPNLNLRKHKYGVRKQKKNIIKKCQNKAWTSATNRGYENSCVRYSDNHNVRTCIRRFHSIVIRCDSNDDYELKIGAAPTMCLTKFSIEHESYKEESSSNRIVDSPEDLQCVRNYEMNNNTSKNAIIPSTITPARESRNKKRN